VSYLALMTASCGTFYRDIRGVRLEFNTMTTWRMLFGIAKLTTTTPNMSLTAEKEAHRKIGKVQGNPTHVEARP